MKVSTCSLNVCYTDESINEIEDLFNNKSYYVGPDGEFRSDLDTATLQYVLHNFTQ